MSRQDFWLQVENGDRDGRGFPGLNQEKAQPGTPRSIQTGASLLISLRTKHRFDFGSEAVQGHAMLRTRAPEHCF